MIRYGKKVTSKVTQSVNDVSTKCQRRCLWIVINGVRRIVIRVSGELLAVVPEELLLKLPSSAILVFVSTLLTHRWHFASLLLTLFYNALLLYLLTVNMIQKTVVTLTLFFAKSQKILSLHAAIAMLLPSNMIALTF